MVVTRSMINPSTLPGPTLELTKMVKPTSERVMAESLPASQHLASPPAANTSGHHSYLAIQDALVSEPMVGKSGTKARVYVEDTKDDSAHTQVTIARTPIQQPLKIYKTSRGEFPANSGAKCQSTIGLWMNPIPHNPRDVCEIQSLEKKVATLETSLFMKEGSPATRSGITPQTHTRSYAEGNSSLPKTIEFSVCPGENPMPAEITLLERRDSEVPCWLVGPNHLEYDQPIPSSHHSGAQVLHVPQTSEIQALVVVGQLEMMKDCPHSASHPPTLNPVSEAPPTEITQLKAVPWTGPHNMSRASEANLYRPGQLNLSRSSSDTQRTPLQTHLPIPPPLKGISRLTEVNWPSDEWVLDRQIEAMRSQPTLVNT